MGLSKPVEVGVAEAIDRLRIPLEQLLQQETAPT